MPWTARVTNEAALERIRPEIPFNGKITKQKLTYFGHVMRANSLEKTMMLGMVSGQEETRKTKNSLAGHNQGRHRKDNQRTERSCDK